MPTKSHSELSPSPIMVVARYELRALWLSLKGLTVLFGYVLLLSVLSYVAASEAALNLLDARESVGIVVQVAIGLSTLAALVVSSDMISGERERDTLEALLVTPVPRRALVIGKMAAASSMWLIGITAAVPYVISLAGGPGVTGDAIFVLGVAGSLVGLALTAMGMAISAISMSNRVSVAASVGILLILAAPSQLPAVTADGVLGSILIASNPVSAGLKLAGLVLIDQKPLADQWHLLISPVVAVAVMTFLAIRLSSRVRLGGAR